MPRQADREIPHAPQALNQQLTADLEAALGFQPAILIALSRSPNVGARVVAAYGVQDKGHQPHPIDAKNVKAITLGQMGWIQNPEDCVYWWDSGGCHRYCW